MALRLIQLVALCATLTAAAPAAAAQHRHAKLHAIDKRAYAYVTKTEIAYATVWVPPGSVATTPASSPSVAPEPAPAAINNPESDASQQAAVDSQPPATLTSVAPAVSAAAAPAALPIANGLNNKVVAVAKAAVKQGCGVRFISARGSFQQQGQSSTDSILTALEDASRLDFSIAKDSDEVQYPATYSSQDNYVWSLKLGSENLQSQIKNAVDECSSVKIALFGYSQGANVVADAVCGSTENGNGISPLAARYQDNVRSIILMGDPSHSSSQTFVVGATSSNGVMPRTTNPECEPFTDRIRSWCNPGDPYCASGSDGEAHQTYMTQFSDDAADFTLRALA